MVSRLERHHRAGHLHFVTVSCYHRLAYLNIPTARNFVETVVELARRRYEFAVIGCVVMPEHVHMLVSELAWELLAMGIQALKLSAAKRAKQRPFWQARYDDFNVSQVKDNRRGCLRASDPARPLYTEKAAIAAAARLPVLLRIGVGVVALQSMKSPPWDWRIVLNGKADEMAYDHGLLVSDGLSRKGLKQRARINPAAPAANGDADFSARIRANRPGFPAQK